MAIILNEEKFINDNTLLLDEKLKSPTVRYIDQSPSFTTYFHINVHETTSDEGWHDVETIIGKKSPMRFQKIESFPIYGLEPIVLQIQEGEMGFDTSYEGEATILPNTIKPLENDFFFINVLDDCFLFRVTGIEFDTIRQDNFYKIHFKLDSNDREKREDLESLVHDKYTCLLHNIGTENQCIIQKDYKNQMDLIGEIYNEMVQLYLSIFYTEKYNSLLGEMGDGNLLYDPFMTEFINSHGLFYRKDSLSSVFLTDQFRDSKRKLKYERSVYRMFEKQTIAGMTTFPYTIFKGTANTETDFYAWSDDSVYIVDIPPQIDNYRDSVKVNDIFSTEFVTQATLNTPTENVYQALIIKFLRKEEISIFDITSDLKDELILLDATLELFFITPLILYVIQKTIENFYATGYAYDTGTSNDVANTPDM